MEQLDLEADATFSHALHHGCVVVGFKRVAKTIFPEFSIEDAARRLSHCFDSERREKLSLEQVELILQYLRQHDCHIPINYLTDTLGYERAEPVTPETERDKLQRQYIEATRLLADIAKRLERNGRAGQ